MLLIAVDNMEVGPWPMTPCQEGIISLRCSYQGEEGWYSLTMPVNRRVAMASGRLIGFPKYAADEITFTPSGNDWRGEVLHESAQRLLLEFTPGKTEEHMTWQEKVFPMFNLTPPGKGPEVKRVDWKDKDVAANYLTSIKMMAATDCARVTLRGVARNKGIIPVTGFVRALRWLYRLNPALLNPMQRRWVKGFRALRSEP